MWPRRISRTAGDLLWNEKYKNKIFMFDNPRDAFGIALKKLGYSMNSTEAGGMAGRL